ncbi:DUF4854 domain-containing protein [Christensenellaceae bacterium NSJ-44]|jgi:RAB protein geranylgeranyltransferase component A|uniref:DUF4854 domain-containing protein n=1 Tax=Luoshenia tenuis TaxID=2763654 RepID=A0A926CYJ0_9FIRM|nr:DUF4854 domain-containing protein [Luoshenia tenuis]MBC8528322.1 DUF4854 domain-containing protein [Luoshenia tenuis]
MKRVATVVLALVMMLSLAACSSKPATVQDYLAKPEVKTQIDSMIDSLKGSGMDIEVTGEGNKLIYTYTFDEQIDASDAIKEALEDALSSQESTFQNVAKSIETEAKVSDPVVVVEYLNADGSELLVKEFKAE